MNIDELIEQNEVVLMVDGQSVRSDTSLISNIKEQNDVLIHYGVGKEDTPPPPGRGSGRYEKGSGENPNQHEPVSLRKSVKEMKDKGVPMKDIAKALGYSSTTKLRQHLSIEAERNKAKMLHDIPLMKAKGLTNQEIADRFGITEGTVRNYLKQDRDIQVGKITNVANQLKEELKTKRYLDVGAGVEYDIGISRERLKTAVEMLEQEGYKLHKIKVPQASNPRQYTQMLVLGSPDTDWNELRQDHTLIKPIQSYFQGGGATVLGLQPVESISSDRVMIRYADQGGLDRDGIIQLRRGVDDISLGGSYYSQVRIGVDGTHYMKGMAIYADDEEFPPGIDVIYNSNKKSGTDKYDVYKKMKRTGPNETGPIDQDNPFGASIKPLSAGGQSYYISADGTKKLRVINKVNDEGDWLEWSKSISPQVLSKQPPELVERQLYLTLQDKQAEFDEIMSIEFPTVRKKLLETFSDDCDASASHLKARAFPNQATHVLIASPSLKENEIYAPNYEQGERLACIRFPHNGPAEIVEGRVNNRNTECRKTIGVNAPDAIGLHPSQFQKLSGADSDGDTVVCIPLSKTKLRIEPILEGLRDFDPKQYKFKDPNAPGMTSQNKQIEMGKVTNLIADMGIFGATEEELTRAIKHSMVVIDSEKHHLDYKQSEIDNGIQELKKKYQRGGGASTLITRAGSEEHIRERKLASYEDPVTGKKTYGVNPNTGEKVWVETGATYKKPSPTKKDPDRMVTEYKTEEVTKMDMVTDAMELLSSQTDPHPVEVLYGKYANALKKMANEARKEMVNTPRLKKDPQAAQEYKDEVQSLTDKAVLAKKNAPRERQAHIIANAVMKAKIDANPEILDDKSYKKRLRGQALTQARDSVGAKKPRIVPTEREVQALKSNALSDNAFLDILNNMDDKTIKEVFTPREQARITPSMDRLARSMASNGYSNKEIAERLGVSASTISKLLRS